MFIDEDRWRLRDLIGGATYERSGADLLAHGLYIDEAPWKAMVLSLTRGS